MEHFELIMIIIVILANIGMFINFWVKFNVKIKELDMKIEEMKTSFEEFRITRSDLVDKNELSHSKTSDRINERFNILNVKMDKLLEIFNEFRLYYEKDKRK